MGTTIGKSVCCNQVKAEDIKQESSTVFYWDIDSALCGLILNPKPQHPDLKSYTLSPKP